MILQHYSVDLPSENDNEDNRINRYVFLNGSDDNDEEEIVAETISLDIRGNYGFFLNRDEDAPKVYEWKGNQFRVIVNEEANRVHINDTFVSDEEVDTYEISFSDWNEALADWKNFYLNELGFLQFDNEAMNHFFGVFILGRDLFDTVFDNYEYLTEAIKKCANRFCVKESVIYRDCRKITGLYSIEDFYKWVDLLYRREHNPDTVSIEFIMQNIGKYVDDIDVFKEKMIDFVGVKI